MAKLKNCKSCNAEVAKSAKQCPSCGQKLKMGFMAKLGIVIVVGIAAAIAGMPSSEDIEKKLAEVEAATPSNIEPGGSLASMFSFVSDSTDIQRENKENEIVGNIVEWRLPVYEVRKLGDTGLKYKIQTTGGRNNVGTFVTITARDATESKKIEGLSADDVINVKGEITGIFMRNINIEHARINF
jgi:RNA polymerase subunit RPABC4/transcription elongation factor Spt4